MSTTNNEQTDLPNHFGIAEAITIVGVWLGGVAMIALIAINYRGEQNVSLENSIAYVVIGVALVSLAVLFRDAIVDWIRTRSND